ncbi:MULTISPECIES: glycine zipper 2TM domain-containing protein [unclassified Thiomonas]|jgi:outer membrane lipoprotein SlyB|uniref:glycine zipper 2TM domain-containing protein n=1 Tax=unclassified Thiomonas TaxID=2625466 RepID=UPI00257BD04D|nr:MULTISPECIES: glycine zipper 2TM domain-containing protein [unclassified Thiomonas]
MSYTNITRKRIWVALFSAGVLTLPACSALPTSSAFGYSQGNTQQVQQVQLGTVLAVIPVRIQPQTSGLGPLAGLAAGGALGHQIGNGRGQTAATLIGAVAGAIAGNRAEAATTQSTGEQVTVKLQSGQVIAVTQAADVRLHVGQQVQVVGGGWGGQPARVLPLSQGATK